MHFLILGLILGWGAAIPIGPVNLEIVRRNLNYGTKFGVSLGLGACTADLTYLILLGIGTLTFFNKPSILAIIGIFGSIILAWFGIKALRKPAQNNTIVIAAVPPTALANGLAGYIITLLNPYTILFWASVSSQITLIANSTQDKAMILTGLGVILGTVSWVICLNGLVHLSRQKLSVKITHRLNQAGGVILLGFAIFGLIHALKLLLN